MWHRCKNNCAFLPSRLARALWIEGTASAFCMPFFQVEARESLVDRRLHGSCLHMACAVSRLARALWIEGCCLWYNFGSWSVEARESLVDRRLTGVSVTGEESRRGSREPCGSKGHLKGRRRETCSRRGSREPCGSKEQNL